VVSWACRSTQTSCDVFEWARSVVSGFGIRSRLDSSRCYEAPSSGSRVEVRASGSDKLSAHLRKFVTAIAQLAAARSAGGLDMEHDLLAAKVGHG